MSSTITICPICCTPPSWPLSCSVSSTDTRDPPILVAACLLFAGWRRIPLRSALMGLAAIVCGGLVSRHFGQAGTAGVHGLSGGVYILGKLMWSFFKNFLGLPLWSNTLPECQP